MASVPVQISREVSPSAGVDWARYRDNLPRHLIGIARDLEHELMATMASGGGFTGLRPSFGPFLALLEQGGEAGPSVGDVARTLAVSKQACSQLVDLVEAAGYAARQAHPRDGRSRCLVLTASGRRLVAAGRRQVASLEADYSTQVGVATMQPFASALMRLYRDLGFTAGPNLAPTVAVLPQIVDRLQQVVMERTAAKGHPDLKRSFASILLLIGPDGGRVSEMARVQGVSRQAISAVSREIESLGYLDRAPDPRDGRRHVLALSARGERLLADSVETVDEIESELEARLGLPVFSALRKGARVLYGALGLERPVFES